MKLLKEYRAWGQNILSEEFKILTQMVQKAGSLPLYSTILETVFEESYLWYKYLSTQ